MQTAEASSFQVLRYVVKGEMFLFAIFIRKIHTFVLSLILWVGKGGILGFGVPVLICPNSVYGNLAVITTVHGHNIVQHFH